MLPIFSWHSLISVLMQASEKRRYEPDSTSESAEELIFSEELEKAKKEALF